MSLELFPATPEARARLGTARRWVIKIGSALLTASGRGLDRDRIECWAEELAGLRRQGYQLALVSSGAVAEGVSRLGLARRPDRIHELQAAAAVGQMGLIQAWETAFARHGLHTALVLLTHDDLADRERYLNARSTLRTLLDHGVIPVINENDTVATDEIRFGDNDTLGALVANLLEADALMLLTDQPGLHERDPRQDASAAVVPCALAADPVLDTMAGVGAGHLGRGGMVTKLRAARLAARSGACTLIADGREAGIIGRLAAGGSEGTLLLPETERLAARKRWIAGQLQTRGTLVVDAGAAAALRDHGRSLLPVGVRSVEGAFVRGEVVVCRDESGREIARGLVNYSAAEARRISGRTSAEIASLLGFAGEPELVHRDNLVLV
ncbi:MAG: glutamate 5-kinase [Gammaproteobacteria bacterium]|nr:MAG: glutamate 5-kinase [Gammaproteobacteria bacterium]